MSAKAAQPSDESTIAILGGTGPEGRGLALRWSVAGRRVIIGSRDKTRAEEATARVAALLAESEGAVTPRGLSNEDAAREGDVIVLAVPYAAQAEVLSALRPILLGKILVSPVVPLRPPKVTTIRLPEAGSAAAEAQAIVGESTPVVAAFQNVGAHKLSKLEADPACDVLVCGDDEAAKVVALSLVAAAGLKGLDAGPLANAAAVEGMTSILIGLNKRYKVRGAGIRISNMPSAPAPPT